MSQPTSVNFVKANFLLILMVLGMFFLNFYQKTIFNRPGSIHQWRQTDCLSIAKNYYEEGMHFFEPSIHYQGVKDGHAVSECPLLNYSAAVLWRAFGEHEFLYRLLEFCIFLCAVFIFFNTILRHSRSLLLSLFFTGLLLSSPLLAYYSLNFLADVPALSLAIMAMCHLYNFVELGAPRRFYYALLIASLAVLLKASALVPFCLVSLVAVSAFWRPRWWKFQPDFKVKWMPLLALALCAAVVLAWYRFALWYNLENNNNIFLLTILPIWDMDQTEIFFKLKALCNNLLPIYLNRPILFLFFSLALYVGTNLRKLGWFLAISFITAACFFVFYILFFFQVFDNHDYYLINTFIFPVITFLCSAKLLAPMIAQSNRRYLQVFLCTVLIFCFFHSASVYRLRSIKDDKMIQWFPFVSEVEMGLASYLFWDYGRGIKHLEDFRGMMRQHGIPREARVLSIPDPSFNISLYFMDQKGFTVARDHLEHDVNVMDRFMDKVDYVVLSDTTLRQQEAFRRHEPELEPYFSEGAVRVFRIKRPR